MSSQNGTTPAPRDAATRRRLVAQRQRDTAPEVRLRGELHRRGLRYRVDHPVPVPRRRADVVFTRKRIAVFVDGCYWHGCPKHGTAPKNNADWWRHKLDANVERDRDTDHRLQMAGWMVVRVWEHDDPKDAADRIEAALRMHS
jgi:DNA mismatch endonuclease, patch repair protein